MNRDRLKQALAGVLVIALIAVLAVRFSGSAPKRAVPQASIAGGSAPAAAGPTGKAGAVGHRHALHMPEQLLRNPFAPRSGSGRAVAVPDFRRLHLDMVAVGPNRKQTFARINGRIVHVGGEVGGYRVLAIRSRGVWVQRAGEKKRFIPIF